MDIPNRLTSENLRVEFRPGATAAPGEASTLTMKLVFDDVASSGSYKLSVNGYPTAEIIFSFGGDTHRAAIETAINDAATDAGLATTFAVTKVSDNEFTITAGDPDVWANIQVTGSLFYVTGSIFLYPVEYGGETYRLDAVATNVEYTETSDTMEVTPVAARDRVTVERNRSMTINLSLYGADEAWTQALFAGQLGLLTVYETGKVTGGKYWACYVIVKELTKTYPSHNVIELSLVMDRLGSMVIPFDSVY